jgi:hypothetical protein
MWVYVVVLAPIGAAALRAARYVMQGQRQPARPSERRTRYERDQQIRRQGHGALMLAELAEQNRRN